MLRLGRRFSHGLDLSSDIAELLSNIRPEPPTPEVFQTHTIHPLIVSYVLSNVNAFISKGRTVQRRPRSGSM